MYRDNRGSIYIPHTGERIAIGTLSVENFQPACVHLQQDPARSRRKGC